MWQSVKEHAMICAKAIKVYGHNYQYRMMQEECGELIAAIGHYLRKREGGKYQLLEEMADVTIMMEQLVLMVGPDEFAQAMHRKAQRLQNRLMNKD